MIIFSSGFCSRTMSLQLCDVASGSALQLRQLSVNVHCVGFLSETTLTMEWENTGQSQLTAELVCPLPNGASICVYKTVVSFFLYCQLGNDLQAVMQ